MSSIQEQEWKQSVAEGNYEYAAVISDKRCFELGMIGLDALLRESEASIVVSGN